MNKKSAEQRPGKATNAGSSSLMAFLNAMSHEAQSIGVGAEAAPSHILAGGELYLEIPFLEAQIDFALDGILAVDSHGEKIFQNKRHRELWKIPPHISENYTEQLKFFMKQTKNPDGFLKQVSYLYTHPYEVILDEIELVDGTVLDRYSSPIRDKAGKYHGRIWILRDITENRKLEE